MFWPITFDARPDLTTLDNRLAQDLRSSIWQKLDADKQGEGCINPERVFPSSVRQSGSERVEFADCRLRRSLRVPLSVLFGASADAAAGCLALSIERSQGAGNRLAPARTRHPPATNPPSGADVVRPGLPRGRQPAPAARALAVLQHHTGATASQASTLGGEPMDVCASSRAPAAPREIRALVIRFARATRDNTGAVTFVAPNHRPVGVRARVSRHGPRRGRETMELRRVLLERRRELMNEIHDKMRDVREA